MTIRRQRSSRYVSWSIAVPTRRSQRVPAAGQVGRLSLAAGGAGTHGLPVATARRLRAVRGWSICGMRNVNRGGRRPPRAVEMLSFKSGDRRYAWPFTSTWPCPRSLTHRALTSCGPACRRQVVEDHPAFPRILVPSLRHGPRDSARRRGRTALVCLRQAHDDIRRRVRKHHTATGLVAGSLR